MKYVAIYNAYVHPSNKSFGTPYAHFSLSSSFYVYRFGKDNGNTCPSRRDLPGLMEATAHKSHKRYRAASHGLPVLADMSSFTSPLSSLEGSSGPEAEVEAETNYKKKLGLLLRRYKVSGSDVS